MTCASICNGAEGTILRLTSLLGTGNYPGIIMGSLTHYSVSRTIRSTFHCDGLILTAAACGTRVFPFVRGFVARLARHGCSGEAINLVRGKD